MDKQIAAQIQARLRLDTFLGKAYLNMPPTPLRPLQISPLEMRPAVTSPTETSPMTRPDYDAAPLPAASKPPAAAVVAARPIASQSAAECAPAVSQINREHVQQSLPILSGETAQIRQGQDLFNEVLTCERCGLCKSRRQVVFGEGSLQANLMFVGEAPGKDEDFLGRPFISTAGELLTDIIEKGMKIYRSQVFITNIMKCRPPGNRDPQVGESAACLPFLQAQIALVQPRVIVAVGRLAGNILTGQDKAPGELRGKWFTYADIPLTTIYHPSFLLRMRRSLGRGNQYDRDTWADVQTIMRRIQQSGPNSQ